jgi:transcription initiation factor IIE alpha subunit
MILMNLVLKEVIEYLESWDCKPTKENIKKVLNKWIENLYSHVGIEAHKHLLACGIIDNTGMTWEEQDMQYLQQIDIYKKCLIEIGG